MTSSTPHVSLSGFGYLEPLARSIRTSSMPGRQQVRQVHQLPPKLAAITERLSPRSNWMRSAPGSPPRVRSLSPEQSRSITDSLDCLSSEYARSGMWPPNRPPLQTIARSPGLAPVQRRHARTSEWHSPASPAYALPSKMDEPRAWAKAWRV